LGIEIGTLIHVVAATLGVSALLVSSELAFSVVTYLGAVYLLYLGVQAFLERGETAGAEASTSGSLRSVFRQGVFVELLNPKTALFIFAFLPQFADPEQGAVRWQMLLLGALFVTVAICVDGLYGLLAGTLGGWLEGNACIVSAQRYVTGCVYVGLAATTVLAATGP
jgi:threonine/homoserine/homoserine lactone efflux protein